MENTKENNSYIEAQEILKTTNIAGICEKDYEDLSQDNIRLIKEFFGSIDSELNLDFSTEEAFEASMDVIYKNIDRYSSGLLTNVPDDKKDDFLRSMYGENITIFFNEKVINVYPKAYTIMMEMVFGNSKFDNYFTNIDDDSFDFLQNCPKLSEELDSFPAYGRINTTYYAQAIQLLADSVYKNVSEEHMGKVILSYFKNTKIEHSDAANNSRNECLKRIIPSEFVFRKEDYELIINYTDDALEQHLEDYEFINTVMEHSDDEFKAEFVNHMMDKAYENVVEDKERKEASFYNGMICECIGKIDSNLVKNKDKVVDFFVDNNMGKSLVELFKGCEADFVAEKFENRMKDHTLQNSISDTGTMYAFIENMNFFDYKISKECYVDVLCFAIENCDTNIMDALARHGPPQFNTAKFVLQNKDFIKECNRKNMFIKLAIDSAEPGEIDDSVAVKLALDITGIKMKQGIDVYKQSCEEFVKDFSKDNGIKKEIITNLLKKTEKSSQSIIYKTLLYDIYEVCERSEEKDLFKKDMSDWLEILSQDLIEDFVQDVGCFQYGFDQMACSNPDKYPNTVNAIYSIREKTENPDMTEFDEKFSKKELLNMEEIIIFSDKLNQIRLKEGCIPEKYCDAIIRNSILAGEVSYPDDSKVDSMIMIGIMEKARHVLKHEGLDDVRVCIDRFNKQSKGGNYRNDKKELTLSFDWINVLFHAGNYNIFDALFHEVQHAIQYRDINNNDLQTATEYEMIKLLCIEKYKFAFYQLNYKSVNYEIEARVAGRQKTYAYLQELGIPIEKILEGDCNYNTKTYKTYNEYINEEVHKLNDTGKKFVDLAGNNQTLNEIFGEVIKDNPGFINSYPALSCEYNDDGTRKCDIEILEEYENELLSNDYIEKKFNLYEYLINSSLNDVPDIQDEVMLKNADLLVEYQPKTEKGKQILNQIAGKMSNYILKQLGDIILYEGKIDISDKVKKVDYIRNKAKEYSNKTINNKAEDEREH